MSENDTKTHQCQKLVGGNRDMGVTNSEQDFIFFHARRILMAAYINFNFYLFLSILTGTFKIEEKHAGDFQVTSLWEGLI